MAEIVAVHGILNEFAGPETLKRAWGPAILDGLRLAGCRVEPTVSCAFYGDLFRRPGTKASGPPLLGPEDVDGCHFSQLMRLRAIKRLDSP